MHLVTTIFYILCKKVICFRTVFLSKIRLCLGWVGTRSWAFWLKNLLEYDQIQSCPSTLLRGCGVCRRFLFLHISRYWICSNLSGRMHVSKADSLNFETLVLSTSYRLFCDSWVVDFDPHLMFLLCFDATARTLGESACYQI